MHQDIENLLNEAKKNGSMTEKQRKLILAKAEQLGEDTTEVEFAIENILLQKVNDTKKWNVLIPLSIILILFGIYVANLIIAIMIIIK